MIKDLVMVGVMCEKHRLRDAAKDKSWRHCHMVSLKMIVIGSGYGLSPEQPQAITWTNDH